MHSLYAAAYVAASNNPIGSAIGHLGGWLEGIVLVYVAFVGLGHLRRGNLTMVVICTVIGLLLLSLLVIPLFWKGLATSIPPSLTG